MTAPNLSEVSRDEIPTRVHQALCDEFGEVHDRRYQGCFISQSLRQLMGFLSADQIMELETTRNVTNESSEMPLPGRLRSFTTATERVDQHVSQRYDRATHQRFPWGAMRDWLDDHPNIHDLPVTKVAFRLEDTDQLHDNLDRLFEEAVGFTNAGELTDPYYAVMSSTSTSHEPAIRRAVTQFHDDRYFKKGGDGDRPGLGWKKRTLDLDAVWSYRAFTESGGTPLYGLTMRDFEDLAINHLGETDHEYGAINSKLVINKWRKAFSRGTTETKPFKWTEHGEWVRVGDDE